MPQLNTRLRRLSHWFQISVGITALSSILGFLGKGIWPLEQFSHFQSQYLFGLSTGVVFFLATRRYAIAGAVTLLALINVNQILPGFFPPSEHPLCT